MIRLSIVIVVISFLCVAACARSNVSSTDRALRQGIHSGDLAIRQGRLQLAEDLYANAVDQAALSGDPTRMFDAVCRHAGVLARLGREHEALGTLDEYITVHAPGEPELTHVLMLTARIELLAGRADAAHAIVHRLPEMTSAAFPQTLRQDAELLRALIEAERANHERAEAIIVALDASTLSPAQQADVLRCRALAAHSRGDYAAAAEEYLAESQLHIRAIRPDAGARALAAAAEQRELLGDHASASRLRLRAGTSYFSLGRKREAITLLERAAENADQADDHEMDRLAQRLLLEMRDSTP